MGDLVNTTYRTTRGVTYDYAAIWDVRGSTINYKVNVRRDAVLVKEFRGVLPVPPEGIEMETCVMRVIEGRLENLT